MDPDFVYRSAKYVDQSYEEFEKKYGLSINTPMPRVWFLEELRKFHDENVREGT